MGVAGGGELQNDGDSDAGVGNGAIEEEGDAGGGDGNASGGAMEEEGDADAGGAMVEDTTTLEYNLMDVIRSYKLAESTQALVVLPATKKIRLNKLHTVIIYDQRLVCNVNSWKFGLYCETLPDDHYRIKHLDKEFYDDEKKYVQYVIVYCNPDDYYEKWVILDKEFRCDD